MVEMDFFRWMKLVYYTVVIGALASSFVFAQTSAVSSVLCSVVDTVRGFIAILALLLFIIGGTLYAIAHFMPAAGNMRGNMQGWSLGMIVGGLVGIILVLIAPGIVNIIAGASGGTVATTTC